MRESPAPAGKLQPALVDTRPQARTIQEMDLTGTDRFSRERHMRRVTESIGNGLVGYSYRDFAGGRCTLRVKKGGDLSGT